MSLLLYCIFATVASFVLGRVNKSDKLFWYLLLSFGAGAVGAEVVDRLSNNNEVSVVRKQSTLCDSNATSIMLGISNTEHDALCDEDGIKIPAPMSQKVFYRDNDIMLTTSVSKHAEDIRVQQTYNPLNPSLCLNTSTHLDVPSYISTHNLIN